jgi:Transposase DDE domain
MAHAHAPSLSANLHPGHPSGLPRAVRRWLIRTLVGLEGVIARSATACRADAYRKHFPARSHVLLLLYHGLSDHPSLKASYQAVATWPEFSAHCRLDAGEDQLSVSYSQVARSSTSRPAALLAGLVPVLAGLVRQALAGQGQPIPPWLRVLDSTVLHLRHRSAAWVAPCRQERAEGVRIQVLLAPADDVVEGVLVSDTHTNDVQGLDGLVLDDSERLAALLGLTLTFDLGYTSHERAARLRAAGVHLVCRLHPQASVADQTPQPVQQPLPGISAGRIQVLHDQAITLGSANNRAGAVLAGMRQVRAVVSPTPAAAKRGAQPVVYDLITDRWDLAAHEVVQLYLWRWEIETFFRWLKGEVRLARLLGRSQNAVELSIWLAIVVHLLTTLAGAAVGLGRRSAQVRRLLRLGLEHLTLAEVRAAADAAAASRVLVRQLALPGLGP